MSASTGASSEPTGSTKHRPPYSHELYAMAKHLAVSCTKEEVAFLDCKDKYDHPEDCLPEGDAVTKCAKALFLRLRQEETFKKFAHCLEYNTLKFQKCRQELEDFEKAVPLS